MLSLIDGDVLVYQSAFTAEYAVYKEKDSSRCVRYSKMKEDEKEYENLKVVEPFQKAKDAMDSSIGKILRATKADKFIVYVSEGKNFRHELTTKLPEKDQYKANRNSEKPLHYQALREYLRDEYKAIFVKDYEADDALSIMHTYCNRNEIPSVICSIDKDLLNTPGLHYNPTNERFDEIGENKAIKLYMMQILTGDTSDNIAGIPKVGPKTALKIVGDSDNPKDWAERVQEAYRQHYGEKDWKKRFTLARQLLWIHREPLKDLTIDMLNKPIDVKNESTPTVEDAAGGFNAQ